MDATCECSGPHGGYRRDLESAYTEYFLEHTELAGEHPRKARDLASALPPGRPELGELLPVESRHIHHLSGGSSQVLAAALLGSAAEADPSLAWLGEIARIPIVEVREPHAEFEFALDPHTLGEAPYVTTLDLLVEGANAVVCVEAKYWEAGLGSCRCGGEPPEPAFDDPDDVPTPAQERGACSERVRRRPLYYSAAEDVFAFAPRVDGSPCPIAASYQAIRNIAAARALAGVREAAFVLLYDDRNPYFSGSGDWPGWAQALEGLADGQDVVSVRSCSWQQLLGSGAVPDDVVQWALDKHGLRPDNGSA